MVRQAFFRSSENSVRGDPTCSRRCEMACMTRSKCRDSSWRLPGSSNSLPWLLACDPAELLAWECASCWCWRSVATSCADSPSRLSATDDAADGEAAVAVAAAAACGGDRWEDEGIGHLHGGRRHISTREKPGCWCGCCCRCVRVCWCCCASHALPRRRTRLRWLLL